MRHFADSKNSNSFELVVIDDNAPATPAESLPAPTSSRGCSFELSPRGRLLALAGYLLISGMSSLYFCLVQAGLDRIQICQSIGGCLLFSTQGWPALGQASIDLLVMSYISGTVSLLGGILGAFGVFAAYKESSSKVRLFARAWWVMIGIFIGSTVLTLFLTVVHKERFLAQCGSEHDAALGTTECGSMYIAALVGSVVGCLIGVMMIWCYGEDVVKYSVQLETIKGKQRQLEEEDLSQL